MSQDIIPIADAINWDHSLNRGLVAWWLCLPDQQRGVIWRDLCRRYDGTLTGMVPSTDWGGTNRVGGFGELRFDSGDDYVVGATNTLQTDSAFTFWCWMRTTNTTTFTGIASKADNPNNSSGNGWLLYMTNSGGDLRTSFYQSTLARNAITLTACDLTGNGWHFVGMAYNGSSSVLLYADGHSTSAAVTGHSPATANDLQLGRFGTASSLGLVGALDDCGLIEGRAWTADQFRQRELLSRQGYPGLLNRFRRRGYSPAEAGGGFSPFWAQYATTILGVPAGA